jgi:hypothetical protein
MKDHAKERKENGHNVRGYNNHSRGIMLPNLLAPANTQRCASFLILSKTTCGGALFALKTLALLHNCHASWECVKKLRQGEHSSFYKHFTLLEIYSPFTCISPVYEGFPVYCHTCNCHTCTCSGPVNTSCPFTPPIHTSDE